MIELDCDLLFVYNGLYLLVICYLVIDYLCVVYELLQECWLIIVLYLMQYEYCSGDCSWCWCMLLVCEVYWVLLYLYMIVVILILVNVGKVVGQLLLCFIDIVDDSLQGIYDFNIDVVWVFKYGGGVGVYLGYVCLVGVLICGVVNFFGGVVLWIKQFNNMVVSVDQFGQCKGVIVVYLDVWYCDIENFFDLCLNNGDQCLCVYDVFILVCLLDLFMEVVEWCGDWYLFDLYEVKWIKGWYLQDFYDEQCGQGSFCDCYVEVVVDECIGWCMIKVIDLFKWIMVSQLEIGNFFMFYWDEVNWMNFNKYVGKVYFSNLCIEILQNMSLMWLIQEMISGDQIVIMCQVGDFVVCNLFLINFGCVVIVVLDLLFSDVLEWLVLIQVCMFDNVIDFNQLLVLQVIIINCKYCVIGLGIFGWYYLLVQQYIVWDVCQVEDYVDMLYECINYLVIQVSMCLVEEKGCYSVFFGSDWYNGEYFCVCGYDSLVWQELVVQVGVYGLCNGWLMVVVFNMSIVQIVGFSVLIDLVYGVFYYEEKKDFWCLVVVLGLLLDIYFYYEKGVYWFDQFVSIWQNVCCQCYVDQLISFNLYVFSIICVSILFVLYMSVWCEGFKMMYYVCLNDIDIDECEWCGSQYGVFVLFFYWYLYFVVLWFFLLQGD